MLCPEQRYVAIYLNSLKNAGYYSLESKQGKIHPSVHVMLSFSYLFTEGFPFSNLLS